MQLNKNKAHNHKLFETQTDLLLKQASTLDERYTILKERYTYKQGHYLGLQEIKKLKMNFKTKEELYVLKTDELTTGITCCIENFEKSTGIKKRATNKQLLIEIMLLFYTICTESLSGNVMPSEETIAYMLYPNIRSVKDEEIKKKQVAAAKMRVSRAITALRQMNLIKTYEYYTSVEHALRSRTNMAYSYALTPPSEAFNMKVTIKIRICLHKGKKALKISLQRLSKKSVVIPFLREFKTLHHNQGLKNKLLLDKLRSGVKQYAKVAR